MASPPSSSGEDKRPLGLHEIPRILKVLKKAGFTSAAWWELGLELKLGLDKRAIEKDNNSAYACLLETIEIWLRNGEDPSWEALADAVCECEHGGKNVAATIRREVGLDVKEPQNAPPNRQQSMDSAFSSEGRPSVSSPPVSPTTSLTASGQSHVLSEEAGECKRYLKTFSTRFTKISINASDAIERCNIRPTRIIRILKRSDPFMITRSEHQSFLNSLDKDGDIDSLFISLEDYWDHFNYHLLEKIVIAPDMESIIHEQEEWEKWQKLQTKMDQYVEDLKKFRIRTKLGVYYEVVDKRDTNIPAGFKELVTKHEWTKENTLEDVEQFRYKMADKYRLSHVLLLFKSVVFASVFLTWWIPAALVVAPCVPGGKMFDADDEVLMISLEGQVIWTIESLQLYEDPPIGVETETETPPPKRKVTETQAARSKPVEEAQVVKSKGNIVSTMFSTVSGLVFTNPLRKAIRNNDHQEVARLIDEEKIDPSTPFVMGWTPLMEASSRGCKEAARVLLEKGANPNAANFEGWTALMAACNRGRFAIVDLLLSHGANPDMQDHGSWSALMAAVYKGHEAIALRIIEAGATPHLQDKDGTNALILATFFNHPKMLEALLAHNPDLNVQDKHGETVLITACKMRNLKLVKLLLKHGADPNIANNDGETPLLLATGRKETEMAKTLLDAGANHSKGAMNPLLLATHLGVNSLVRLMLSYGADRNQTDQNGLTPHAIAAASGNEELAQMTSTGKTPSPTQPDMFESSLKALSQFHDQLSRGPLFYFQESKTPRFFQRIGQAIFGQ